MLTGARQTPPSHPLRRSPLQAVMSVLACISLIAALGVSTAGVAGATVAVPGNPDLGQACGLDFALVIDRSGSVAGAGASLTVRNAAKAFLGALVDTGSRVSLTSFAATATVDNAATPLTSANLAGLNAKVDGLTFGGLTNWEDALIKAQSTFGAFTPAGRPPLVVVITDGNPNRWMDGTSVSSSGGTARSLAEAVGQAATIKAGGTHMFTLGVAGSSGLNTTALQAISGPDAWPATPFASADWTSVSSFNNLENALLDIATDLCGGTVIVHKLVDGQPAGAGWHFSAPGGTSTPGTGDTDSDGIVNFAWDSPQDQTTDLTETQKPGYTLTGAGCLLNGNATGTPIANGVHLTVGPRDTVQCTFNNRTLRAAISVEKTASPTVLTANGLATYTYVVTNAAEAPLGGVVVTDDKCSPMSLPSRAAGDNGDDFLDVGETWTYTCAATLAVDTTNTATATGTPPVGPAVTDTDTATVDVVNPGLDIVKTGPAQAREGETVTYHFAVRNTGDTSLSGIVVTDDVIGAIGTIPTLAAGATVTLEGTYTIPAGHPADVVNIGTACVSATVLGDTPLCDNSTHTLDVLHPAIHVAKSVNKPVITAGTTVTYSYLVTNPGDIALSGVALTDDKCAAVTATGGDTDHDNLLDVGETWTYTCSAALVADTVNVATAKGAPPVGPDVTATDTARVDVVNPILVVRKTGPAQAHEGDLVTYRFTVTNTGDVTLANLSVVDDVLGSIGTIDSLVAGASAELTSTYTVPANRIPDVVNTVLVCTAGAAPGDAAGEPLCDSDSHVLDVLHPAIVIDKTANPASVAVSGPVTYSYVITNTGDTPLQGIVVTDDIIGAIGTVDSLAPGASVTLTKTVDVDADTPPTNVGTVTGTDAIGGVVTDTDRATITVVLGGAIAQPQAQAPTPTLVPAAQPAVAVQPAVELPRTGSPLGSQARLGLLLLLGGLVVALLGRRRRKLDPQAD